MIDIYIFELTPTTPPPPPTKETPVMSDTHCCEFCDDCLDDDFKTTKDDTQLDGIINRLDRLEDLVLDLAEKAGFSPRFVLGQTTHDHWELGTKGNKK